MTSYAVVQMLRTTFCIFRGRLGKEDPRAHWGNQEKTYVKPGPWLCNISLQSAAAAPVIVEL